MAQFTKTNALLATFAASRALLTPAQPPVVQPVSTKVEDQKAAKSDAWFLKNLDNGEMEFGSFPATEVTENVGSTYANTFALNRQKAITQFLHGNLETISFTAKYFAVVAGQDIQSRVEKIKNWTRRDLDKGRPPVCQFWIGDQHARAEFCLITNVSVAYGRPGHLGAMRDVTLNITLQRYDPFSLTETASFDTRYHMARTGDTYEMLAVREYGNPMLGVELRQRHPKQRRLDVGQIVKLPNRNGSIRRAKIEPKSVALSGILSRKLNAQQINLTTKIQSRKAAQYQYLIK